MKKYQFGTNDRTVYMNVEMTSEYLHVAKSTIYKWVGDSFIPHKKLGKRVLFIKDDIDEWVQNNGVIVKDLPDVPKSLLKDLPEVKNISPPEIERTSERQHMIIKYRPAV